MLAFDEMVVWWLSAACAGGLAGVASWALWAESPLALLLSVACGLAAGCAALHFYLKFKEN